MEKVDSYKFVGGVTKRVVRTWIEMEEPGPIPWTPLSKPLSECKVALLSSGGIALKTDQPFDQEGERQNPFWGDPSHRLVPADATAEDIRVYHLHIDPRPAETDLNCLLPVDRLRELAEESLIGAAADWHYATMGYILDPTELLEVTTPKITEHLKSQQVDALILVPS
ncbi:MAG: glycine/sarcosine/betaine reductase selenoprotein B family protein [Anaerolineales bacterium]